MKNSNITKGEFRDSFIKFDRLEQFGYDGLGVLYDYLTELEASLGEELELDVVALCCDYTRYDSFEDLRNNYDYIENMDDLRDHTAVIEFDGGIIIQNF
ncbi:MAG: hypothetical protein KKB37_17060 [Alphaproteobacteria bacterium]|nr:hypothetical protein [Alphaproteobacteria bacterium]